MIDFLHEKYHEAVSRQNAFLLAATGSGIAFALHQTANRTLAWSLLPVGLALLTWAAGFVAGIFNGHAKQTALRANIAMNLAKNADRPDFYERSQAMFEAGNSKAQSLYQIQLWALLLGAMLYVGGHAMHIWEQAERSKASSQAATIAGRASMPQDKSSPNPEGTLQRSNPAPAD